MSVVFAVYVGVPLVTVAINVGIATWVYSHHETVRGSRWFVATLLLGAGWMVTSALAFVLSTPDTQILAATFATKFAVLSFVAQVVFASRYTSTNFHRHPLARGLLGFVLLVTLLPTWVEPIEQLLYQEWTVSADPIQYVTPEPGPLYAGIAISLCLLVAYSMYVLVQFMLSTARRSAMQLVSLVLGSLSIMIAIMLGNLGVFPIQEVNNAQFGALPFSVFLSLALFRFRLFETEPVARNVVVENLRDPVLVFDRDLYLVDYNEASIALWPAIEDATGEALEVACPDIAGEITLAGGDLETSASLAILVDGERRHYSVEVSTVGDDADPRLYALLMRDVTDLERSLWQLEKQNERLDQVAATISHDLRNPINVAAGYAQTVGARLAGDDLDPEVIADAQTDLQRIRDAHDRMEDIIDDVLTLAREGQAVETTETVSLSGVACDAWETVATGEATLTIADDRRFAADRSKLLTLLENLYRNAVEHGGADVTVTVEPLANGFAVADDGPGIPQAHADSVFEYGYTTEDDGTGLGLSIVRTIAESHGWTVELAAADDGTRFEFTGVSAESGSESAAPGADQRADAPVPGSE